MPGPRFSPPRNLHPHRPALSRPFAAMRRLVQRFRQSAKGGAAPHDLTQALAATEADFARAERLAHLGTWKWDLLTGVVTWSVELFRVFGVDPGSITPSPEAVVAMLHPSDRARHAELLAKALKGEAVGPFECRVVRADGEERIVQATGFDVEFDQSGKPVRAFCALLDVTERRRTEDALRLTEARFRAIAGSTADHIVVHDRDLRYVTVINPQLGLAEADMIGKSDRDFLLPAEAETLIAAKRSVLESGNPLHFETSLTNRTGGTEFFDGTFIPRTDSDGQVDGLIGYFRNVTERKRAETLLAQSEERYRRIYETSPLGIVTVAGDGRFLTANPAFCRLLGYTEAELLSLTFVDVTGRDDVARDVAESLRLVAGQIPVQNTEKRYLRKDGTPVWASLSATAIRDHEGRFLSGLAVIEDIAERKLAEAALQESERRLATLMANLPGMAYRCGNSLGWPMVFVNEGCRTLTGHSAEAVMGNQPTFGDLIVPADREPVWDAVQQAVALRQPFELTYQIQAADGRLKWVWERGRGVFGDDGTLLFLEGFINDISERKEAEEALRASELKYRIVADNTFDWEFWLNPDGRFLYTSPSCERISGHSQAEFEADPHLMLRIVHPEDLGAFRRHNRRALAAEGSEELQFRVRHADGSIRWIGHVCAPFRDAAGAFLGVRGSNRDITKRKQAEEALVHAHKLRERALLFNAALLSAIPTPVFYKDGEGRYLGCNRAFAEILGLTPEEIQGKTAHDLWPGGHAEVYHAKDLELMANPGQQTYESTVLDKNGDERTVLFAKDVFRDEEGQPAGIIGAFLDITDRTRLESQLRQAQKLEGIGQLAGGVAHDFNNILGAMIMHLGLLQMNEALDGETRQGLSELEEDAKRATALVRQLLIFSRRSILAIKPEDLNEIVANILKMLSRVIGEDIELTSDTSSGLPTIEADAGMVEQVVLNLVVNARDAMPGGGRITIGTSAVVLSGSESAGRAGRRAGRFVCLSVTDSGAGMDDATLKHLFEPFFTTKEPGKGTGLGLATVHGIVVQHEGWVEVESAVGCGTTFRVFLPASDRAAATWHEDSTPLSAERGRETILLVEDEANLRQTLCRALRTLGYRVHEAANGEEALRLFDLHGPEVDLVFTDMVMPEGMTGLELTTRLRALKPALQAIVSSGYSGDFVQAGAPDGPGIAFLPKPYEVTTLAAVIRTCLDSTPRPDLR